MNSLGYLDSILSEGPANGNFQVCRFLEATVKASAVTLTNRMWFSVFRTLIDNEYVSSQWPKCFLDIRDGTVVSKITKEIFAKIR